MILVENFENYSISPDGTITNIVSNKVKKPVLTETGYLSIKLHNKGGYQQYKVHRLVAKHFVPNINNKPFVNHIDGNKLNNHYSNLEWCTASENMQHALETKLLVRCKGEAATGAKLTKEQVQFIFKHTKLISRLELSKMFNISKVNIHLIQKGKSRFEDIKDAFSTEIINDILESKSLVIKKYKQIIELDSKDNIIKEWKSANEIAIAYNIRRASICQVAAGIRKSINGKKFKYK